MDENICVLPGESGSVAEALGSAGGLGYAGSSEPSDNVNAANLTAAFHFTGTTACANGATMQEYFMQSAISSASQYDLLTTRLRGLSRDWCEFRDQEIALQLIGPDADRLVDAPRSSGASGFGAVSTAAHTVTHPAVHVRLRRSLLSSSQHPDRRLAVLRYLGAVETDKIVSRRSCLEVPVTGPLMHFLQELGFEPGFTYVAEGQIYVRGRVKACVYSVSEVVQFEAPPTEAIMFHDPIPKEWRRLCNRSWLVEISAIGSPSDESLQDEVSDFADLLHPLVTPAKLDANVLLRK